ncbi:Rib/alpha-like domain-containing protein, partial [Streptococcus suis]|nr:Rib/alpha-like domain-containing protein [Streptococcus suis]
MKNYDKSHTQQRFSIKKFKFGAASVLVGLAFLGFGVNEVKAEVNTATSSDTTVTPDTAAAPEAAATDTTATSEAAATEPVAAEGVASTEPVATEPVAAEGVASTEPVATEPVAAEGVASTEPVATEPVAAEGVALRTAAAPAATERAAADNGTFTDRAITSEIQNDLEANAIYSPGTKGQKQSYAGTAYVYRNGSMENHNQADAVVLGGTNVYLQWVNGKGYVSKTYYTTTNSDGTFVIDLSKPEVDANGASHEFKLAGDGDFSIRTWVQNPDPTKYSVILPGDKFYGFHNRLERTMESWDFTVGINRIVNAHVGLQELPNAEDYLHKPEGERQVSPTGDGVWANTGNYGTIRGNVWYENGDLAGSPAFIWYENSWDIRAAGVKMVGSYLNDEVTNLLDAWKAANPDYTLDMMRAAQAQIIGEYEAAHGVGSHIAETVEAVVEADGSYYIPFRGLYGVSSTRQNSGLSISHTITDEEYGTLVRDEDITHSNLMAWNGTVGQKHRHINADYVYVSPVVTDYAVWSKNFQNNTFESVNDNNVNALASYNTSTTDFALLAPQPMHDVLVKDTVSNFGFPGDVVESRTGGLLPNREYQIQWFRDGKAFGDPMTVVSGDDGTAVSYPITVPNDLTGPTVFTSAVFRQGESVSNVTNALAADSFIANIPVKDSLEPSYEEKVVTPGNAATSLPTIKDANGAETTAPEKTNFSIDPNYVDPAGYVVEINETTGEVKVTAPATPTADTAETVEVPVIVTYPDGSTDNTVAKFLLDTDRDGNPDVTDTDDDGDGIPDTEDNNPKTSTTTTVSADDATVTEGQEITPIPVTVTTDDKNATVDVTDLPNGLTYDETTGEITGTPSKITDWGTDEETRDHTVTVEVKDKDGNVVATDTAVITVQRDTDGDGTPDVTDTDDDGDGIPDTEDNNPKTSTTTTVSADDATVTEGQEITPIPVIVTTDDKNATVDVTDLPNGLTYDETTGEITGTPSKITDWGTDEETRDHTVTVEVKDKDGNVVATDTAVITVQRDTDGDGTPDVTDTDDDGDGIPDTEDNNPKTSTTTTVSADDATVTEGQEITPIPVTVTTDDKNATVEVTDLPDGLTYDETTGEITGTPSKITDWGTDEETRDHTVTVEVKDKDGNVVATDTAVITVQRDTDGDGEPDVTDTDDDGDGIPDTEEATDGTNPKDPNSVGSAITPIDDQTGVVGEPITPVPVDVVKVPTGGSVIVDGLPDGVTYDPSTGEITGTPTTPGTSTVTVTVLDKEGNPVKDASGNPVTETFTFTVTEAPTDADKNTPEVKDQTVNVGETPKAEDSIANLPDLPAGTTVDFKDPVDTTTPGDKEATVVVTYPDGSSEEVTVTITVVDPNTATDADKNTPEVKDQTVNVGETPKAEDSISNLPDLPAGTTVDFKDPVDTTTPGDKEATVVVTYPDGSSEEVTVTITVVDPNTATDADKNTPEVKDQTVNVGETPKAEDSIANLPDLPAGTTVDFKDPVDTTTPGDKEATVIVTYPDGSSEEVTVTITVVDPNTAT